MRSFEDAAAPKQPLMRGAHWLDTQHHGRWGHYARSPFYVWREWVAAKLPPQEAAMYLALAGLMAEDEARSALLKQAQYELSRLWDWQQRRSALGLPPDLPPSSSASASASSIASSEGRAGRTAAPARAEPEAPAADAAGARKATATDVAAGAAASAPPPESGSMLQVLLDSTTASSAARGAGAGGRAAGEEAPGQGDVAGALDGGVLGSSGLSQMSERQQLAVLQRMLPRAQVRELVEDVRRRLDHRRVAGRSAVRRWRGRGDGHTPLPPGPLEDDLFLQPAPILPDAPTLAALPQLPVSDAEAAVYSAAGAGRSGSGGRAWTQLPLLDRRSMLMQQLAAKRSERAEAAARRRRRKWQLRNDGYAFDLTLRPPTPTLDLVTDYLEVKYADVLLRKDTVHALSRRLHVRALAATPGEVWELPPAALAAGRALSPAARAAVSEALDNLFCAIEGEGAAGAAERYVEAVAKLYTHGLLSHGEMAEALAAATARKEEAAAAAAAAALDSAPVDEADRDALFGLISGQAPLAGSSSGSSSSGGSSRGGSGSGGSGSSAAPAVVEAARQAWEAAGSRLLQQWGSGGDAAGSGSGGQGGDAWWQQPLSFEEAQQQWQQLLQLAGLQGAPALEEVLAADAASRGGTAAADSGSSGTSSSGTSGGSVDERLAASLQLLQRRLAEVTGLAGGGGGGALPLGDADALAEALKLPGSLEKLAQSHLQQFAEVQQQRQLPRQGTKKQSPPEGEAVAEGAAAANQQQHQPQQQQQEAWDGWEQLYGAALSASRAAQVADDGRAATGAGGGRRRGARARAGGGGWPSLTAELAARHDAHLGELSATPGDVPPFEGARRLLRFDQTLVLAAGGELGGHPVSLKASLRVSAAELAEEAGLNQQALQHVLRVCGPRYDPGSGEIKISCQRYPSREENRRWCLEVLLRLLEEGQRAHPSDAFLLARMPNPFAQQRSSH